MTSLPGGNNAALRPALRHSTNPMASKRNESERRRWRKKLVEERCQGRFVSTWLPRRLGGGRSTGLGLPSRSLFGEKKCAISMILCFQYGAGNVISTVTQLSRSGVDSTVKCLGPSEF